MKKLHQHLCKKYNWYNSWHKNKNHEIVHILILIFVIGIVLFLEPNAIGKSNTNTTSLNKNVTPFRPFASLQFEKRMNGKKELKGDEAIAALGADISTVAKHYHFTNEQLKANLKNDKTMRLDSNALIFYTDEGLVAPQAATLDAATIGNNPTPDQIPESQTFLLHSKPNATAKIYLNFKGVTDTNPNWTQLNNGNPIVEGPYSADSDSSTFSSVDLRNIRAIWRGVMEAYSGFDVDVTTEAGTSIDPGHYIQINIVPNLDWYCQINYPVGQVPNPVPPCVGGVTYVGSFTSGDGTAGWVLGGAPDNDIKLLSEVIAHEVGHSLGLIHASEYDANCNFLNTYYAGSGSNPGWAPIMGNSYGKGVTQWINTSESQTMSTPGGCIYDQNEISTIVSQNGFGFAPDEAGSTADTAANLPYISNINTVKNIDFLGIMSQNDTDLYKIFTTGGDLSLTINPMVPITSIMLGDADFRVRLLDSNLNVLVESNPPAVASAVITKTGLPAGVYYLEITPSGYLGGFSTAGGYTSTNSMGTYQIVGSYAFDPTKADMIPPTVSITSITKSSNIFTIFASAKDNIGVTQVAFYAGTSLIGFGTSSGSTFSTVWDTTSLTSGTYSLTAKASDMSGNVTTSAAVNAVIDKIAPKVTITSPTSITKIGNSVVVSATATDNVGVTKTELYIDSKLITTVSSGTLNYTWSPSKIARGSHVFLVKAYDATNNIGQASVTANK